MVDYRSRLKRLASRQKTALERPLWHWFDVLIMLGILLVACWVLWGHQHAAIKGVIAEIYYQNRLIDEIPLKTTPLGTFSYPQAPQVVFQIFDHESIAIVRSNCPDQICVRTGKLRYRGDYAACLPNQFVIRLRDEAGYVEGSQSAQPIQGDPAPVPGVDIVQ